MVAVVVVARGGFGVCGAVAVEAVDPLEQPALATAVRSAARTIPPRPTQPFPAAGITLRTLTRGAAPARQDEREPTEQADC